jgi:hypothetical protein
MHGGLVPTSGLMRWEGTATRARVSVAAGPQGKSWAPIPSNERQ